MQMDHMSIVNKTIAVFCEKIAPDFAGINEKTRKEDVETWDSMNHLIFMAELESVFDIRFTTEEITKSDCLEAIIAAIERKMD